MTLAELEQRTVVRVPDLVGQPLAKARLVLEHAGLAVDEVLFRESYEEQDTVLEQEPHRGQMVYEGAAVTLYVARRGYMELLPALYRRSDAVGKNVVRDLCFIFEHLFGSIEATLDGGHRFYDPYECPPDFIPWLASWTAMVVDLDWPLAKKRALVKRAVDLYRIRGTAKGLALFLRLFIGAEPVIEENRWPFKGFRVGVDGRVGVDTVVLPPIDLSQCFTVTVPMKFADVTPEMVIRVHEIIQLEKPANVQYYLRFAADEGDAQLREFFSIGIRAGIGIGHENVGSTDTEDTQVGVPRPAEPSSSPKPEPTQRKRTAKRGTGDPT